jgi:EpsI family protein
MTMGSSGRHALLALAFLATYGFTHIVAPVAPAVPAALGELPMALAPWAGFTAPALPPEVLETLAADDYIRRYYARAKAPALPDSAKAPALPGATGASALPGAAGGSALQGVAPAQEAVEMDISYYAQPRVGANMHSPLNCLPGNGWQITDLDTVALAGLDNVRVQALTVQRGQHRFAMAYWFQSRDRVITGEASTRFHLLADAIQRRPTDTGIVRVMAPITDAASANGVVLAFASRLVPALTRVLRG